MADVIYTVKDVARLTGFSPQTITRIFENEPGVLVLRGGGPKRVYRSFRIPRHVYERVLAKYRQ